jgi:GcrA cell cycle regulator
MSAAADNIWTDDLVKAFRRLHRDPKGFSFTEIATALSKAFNLNITRNACIGKARRLGLPMRDATPRLPIEKKLRKRVRVDAPIPPSVERLFGSTPADGLTIYETREGDCKWPLGKVEDHPPYMYCGHPAELGRPYCITHTDIAYNKPKVSWT